jgi:hypothetical protein
MKALRIILIVLELVVALNAVGGGIYGLAGAAGVPVELLRGSPFQSYFWPSLILLVAVGGSMLTAALLMTLRPRLGALISVGAGLVLAGWIGVQIAIIGFMSWLQPTLFVVALVVIVLSVTSVRRGATES